MTREDRAIRDLIRLARGDTERLAIATREAAAGKPDADVVDVVERLVAGATT